MTTVAVTGSAGFIGSHVVDALLARGYSVVGIDDLSMGLRDNFAQHLADARFTFLHTDVRDAAALRTACQGAEIIVHLAASKIPRYGGAVNTLLTNGKGSEHVLEAARALGCRVVLASTSDVYGKNPALPFSEGHDSVLGPSVVPRWSYAVSKLYEEHLGFAYQEAYRVPVTVLRFFGSYGPRQHRSWWGGPQAAFIEALLQGQLMEIHGDGQQTRSFTYISDTVAGILAAMECRDAVGQVLNIGSTFEISIEQLARLIFRLMDGQGDAPLRLTPYERLGRYEDVRRRVPDLSKANTMLGYEPRVGLEEGLRQTIAWQRSVKDAQVIPVH